MITDVMLPMRRRGAAALEHPGGNLLSHLERTGNRLARWDASPDIVLAGRWHAAYGTDGFPTALFGLDERRVVADAIGSGAEAVVYRYCSCDRQYVYAQLGVTPSVWFRDRFTGSIERVNEAALRAFCELTVANELDVFDHNPAMSEHSATVARRFGDWSALLSEGARADLAAWSS